MHDLLLLIGFPSKIDGVWKEGVAFRRPAKIDGVWKEGVAFRRPATAAASRWRQINDDVTIMMTRQHGVAAEASGFILKTAPSLSAFLIPTSPVFFFVAVVSSSASRRRLCRVQSRRFFLSCLQLASFSFERRTAVYVTRISYIRARFAGRRGNSQVRKALL